MLKLGIIGYPLSHSLSPIMHMSALKELGIKGNYEILETPPENLLERVKELKTSGYNGFNVTIPLKVYITPLLVSVDDAANVVGAVNTVYIDERKDMHGYNTDVYGFVHGIPEELRSSLKNKKAAVIGAGGAARAVVAGLAGLGMDSIDIYARDEKKALKIKEVLTDNFKEIKVKILSYNENCDLSQSSIVVNTTPIGMFGEYENLSPISNMAIDSIPSHGLVYDLIYRPRETKLLKQANKRGLATVDGSEMLVLQGAKALTIWTGKKAPIEIMRTTLLKNL
ncbi:MAG: shikimate dehydrogenase [bacterium]